MKSIADYKTYLGTVISWGLVVSLFPGEFVKFLGWITGYLGPTGFFLIPISAYLLITGVTIIWHSSGYPGSQKENLLTHLEDLGDVAAVLGLLGTVLAMISSIDSGAPDMAKFLEALTSTFYGSGLYVLTIMFRAVMTRPGVVPKGLAEGGKHGRELF